MKEVKCPNCKTTLGIKEDGKYNCPDCKSGFQIEDGNISLLSKGSDIFKKVFAFLGISFVAFVIALSFAISNLLEEGKQTNNNHKNVKQEGKKEENPQEVNGVTADVQGTQEPEKQETIYTVIEVVDGDTVKVNEIGALRLIGIDTPETVDLGKPVQCYGKEASNKAKELLLNQKVTLEFDESQGRLDKYERTLAYIHRTDGLFFNLEMIKQGYAHEYTYSTPYKYQDEFKNAQTEAQNAKRGLWGSTCSCEKGKEVSRACTACNQLTITKSNWDCSTYTEKVSSTSCSSKCPVSTPPAIVKPKPVISKPAACMYSCVSPDRDCKDFSSHSQAVTFFRCCGFTAQNDPMRLDGTGVDDGDPCENS